VISSVSDLLGIPYISNYYETIYFATYLEVMHGIITSRDLEFDPNIRSRYLTARKCIPDIESIVPLPFSWADPSNKSVIQRANDTELHWI
jgi:hypothetical protein